MAEPPSPLPNRRVRTPIIIQMEAVECGAAALGIVLAHHGRRLPLEELRVACGVSRDGSKASNLVKAARRLGLDARGFKCEIAGLAQLPLPAILFWGFNHFVVLDGFGQNGGVFFINDPASGPRRVGSGEFDENYTGVVLTFEPGPDFRRGGTPPGLRSFLATRLRGSGFALAFALFCALFLVVPGVLAPAFTRVFIDDYLIGHETAWLRPLLAGLAVAILVQMALTALQQACLLRFRTKLALASSGRFLAHVLRLPMEYFAQRFPGEISARLALNDRLAALLGGRLAAIALDFVPFAFLGALLFLYDPVLASIAVAVAAVNAAVLRAVSRARADRNRVAAQEMGRLQGAAINGLAIIETLKGGGGEDEFFTRWSGCQARARAHQQSLAVLTQYSAFVPALLDAAAVAVILTLGAFRIMDGQLTVGALAAFQVLVWQFNRPLNALINFGNNLQALGADAARLDDVMRAAEDPVYAARPDAAPFAGQGKLAGRVELRDVTFGYSPLDPPLIEKFNLTLRPGRRVALVGASGSGKSTVARLVAGLCHPWSGEVLLDGHPLATVPRDIFANSLAMVDQEIVLFAATVRDNLSLWDDTLSVEDIALAAKDAAIDGVIAARPGGYESLIEEGGHNFSGGQRQRLEIARALAGHPSILVLDEATSALDAATEAVIDQNLRRRGCSCLIVAHRLSTIRDADEIIVLEHGKVAERGTFEELTRRGGAFAQLMES